MVAQGIPPLSQENFESGRLWESEYHQINPQAHLCRKWKLEEDTRAPLTILRLLPDLQQPQLPEGYLWLSEDRELKILKHQDAPFVNFKIYLFGPDHKERIQYLVVQEDVPTQGFAMTRQEGFSKVLRNDYGSIALNSFKEGDITFWRGHIIDYLDTLGDPVEREKISAIFDLNLKPEPSGCWAQTLRTKLVAKIREGNGSYSETMFYGFTPKKTEGGRPIPEAVSFDKFTFGGREGPELEMSYFVSKEHPCHTWSGKGNKNFTPESLKKLESRDFVSSLIWRQGTLPKQREFLPLNVNLAQLTVKEGYLLRQEAEMELGSAQLKLSYALYGIHHKAPEATLVFWLKRTLETALKMDNIYHSIVPPFQLALLGELSPTLPFVNQLQKIGERVLQTYPQTIVRFIKREEEILPLPPPPLLPPLLRAPPIGIEPTTICCSPINIRNRLTLHNFTLEITQAVERGSPLILTNVYTSIAKKIFPKIQETARRAFHPPYTPVILIRVKQSKWKNSVRELAQEHFGYEGEIQ